MNETAGSIAAKAIGVRCLLGAWFALSALGLVGCQTPAPLAPLNLAEPGWQVRQGQAVWRARPQRPALAGEFLVAWHSDGRGFAQFTKTPFTLLNARLSPTQWQIEFPSERRSYHGGGVPSPQFAWLHLPHALANVPLPPPLEMVQKGDGGWLLVNRHTGEQIDGYLSP
ncbi:MAG: hypothetical protein HZA90_01520 [Verrucomicrobia bacterium]|nr:hypothetical protein [Verrucomicrobiota bacterium]